MTISGTITGLRVFDVRFPTSTERHGSDAMNPDPDYSAAYVIVETDRKRRLAGHGLAFTIGRGTEIVVLAVSTLPPAGRGPSARRVHRRSRHLLERLTTGDSQLRWLGPEKGVIHMASAAVINALWDLWAKLPDKPLLEALERHEPGADRRALSTGITCPTRSPQVRPSARSTAWCRPATRARVPCTNGATRRTPRPSAGSATPTTVAPPLPRGRRRRLRAVQAQGRPEPARTTSGAPAIAREEIGASRVLMLDANQRWDVGQAMEWVGQLSPCRPIWIEEPTSPDDVLGHAAIARAHRAARHRRRHRRNCPEPRRLQAAAGRRTRSPFASWTSAGWPA